MLGLREVLRSPIDGECEAVGTPPDSKPLEVSHKIRLMNTRLTHLLTSTIATLRRLHCTEPMHLLATITRATRISALAS